MPADQWPYGKSTPLSWLRCSGYLIVQWHRNSSNARHGKGYAITMFVRFRQQGNRLQASLMQTRRAAGRMLTEHIASLGSVDAEVSVRERLAFWLKLPDRLARLGNRVGPDQHGKIYGALHARIPMATPDDQRAVQEENAKDDEQFWGS